MKRLTIAATAILAIATTALAFSDEGGRVFREFLNGFKEAPNPIATTATGTFKATITQDDPARIEYEPTFQDLEGDVRQAHIHIGHPQASGGIVLWLCDSERTRRRSPRRPSARPTIPPTFAPAGCRAR